MVYHHLEDHAPILSTSKNIAKSSNTYSRTISHLKKFNQTRPNSARKPSASLKNKNIIYNADRVNKYESSTKKKRPQTAKPRINQYIGTDPTLTRDYNNIVSKTSQPDELARVIRNPPPRTVDKIEKYQAYDEWCRGFEFDLEEYKSVTLLCRLKLDQANLMCGRWKNKPSRIRAAMAMMCMEKMFESMRPIENKNLLLELHDILENCIFTKTGSNNNHEEISSPWIAAELLRDPQIETYFEKCEKLSIEKQKLLKRIDQLSSELEKMANDRSRRRGTTNKKKKKKNCVIDDETCSKAVQHALDLLSSEKTFEDMTASQEQEFIREISFRAATPPSVETIFSFFNQISSSNRKEFLALAISELNKDEIHSDWFENAIKRAKNNKN